VRSSTIWTVLDSPAGRMVHYGTDQREAQVIADKIGGVVEAVADFRWYSPAAFRDGHPHPADRDVAREFQSWQIALDVAEARSEPAPVLSLTGPPFLSGQLIDQ